MNNNPPPEYQLSTCKHCGVTFHITHVCKPKNPAAVALGRLGGKAGRGHVKARTSEQARAAVAVRWAKFKGKGVLVKPDGTVDARFLPPLK